jgi:hypothetical protein
MLTAIRQDPELETMYFFLVFVFTAIANSFACSFSFNSILFIFYSSSPRSNKTKTTSKVKFYDQAVRQWCISN